MRARSMNANMLRRTTTAARARTAAAAYHRDGPFQNLRVDGAADRAVRARQRARQRRLERVPAHAVGVRTKLAVERRGERAAAVGAEACPKRSHRKIIEARLVLRLQSERRTRQPHLPPRHIEPAARDVQVAAQHHALALRALGSHPALER